MWIAKKFAPQRPPTILIIDRSAEETGPLAQLLGREGLHVFWTDAAEVGLRLSREHYFDLVIVDVETPGADARTLADCIARDGQRCVVFSTLSGSWPPPDGHWGQTVKGAVLRPLQAPRVVALVGEVMANPDNYFTAVDMRK